MGSCIQRLYGFTGPQRTVGGTQGLDVSNYQGEPRWRPFANAGIRFVWNQSNDGSGFRDYNFRANYCAQRYAGILPGAYVFLRPGYVTAQVNLLVAQIWSARANCPGAELPPLLDAEVPGAYANVAPAAAQVRARLHVNPCTYASSGLWDGSSDGGTCLDDARWGVSGRAFSGWLYKGGPGNYVAQQWCGYRCYVAGLEVDRQVDHGVLRPVPPPKPPPPKCDRACKRRTLLRLRTLIDSRHHDCRIGDHHHAKPRRTRAEAMKWRRVCNVWLAEGRRLNKEGVR